MDANPAMNVGWYTFVHDFTDGGIDAVADELSDTGAAHVNVALVYHTARDLLPRNPRRRMRFMSGGAHYFVPDVSLYGPELQPFVDAEASDSAIIPSIRKGLVSRGLAFNAWMVFLHNSRAGMANPSLAQRNVFGDAMLTDLCPTNPAVQHYAVALAGDVARQHPTAVLAESLHFHGLRHGYHHERYLFELGGLAELALSLCFCEHCVAEASTWGVRVSAVSAWAESIARDAFDGSPQGHEGELGLEHVRDLAQGELGRFIDVRCDTVERLVGRVRQTLAAHGIALIVLDPSGAVKGWADARPTGAPVHESGWQFGLRAGPLSMAAGGLEVLAYTSDEARLADDLAGYRSVVGDRVQLRASMRPSMPDTLDSAHLRRKIDTVAAAGVTAIDLYHYGLLPPTATSLVTEALSRPGRQARAAT